MDSRKPERTEMQARDEKSNKDDATVVEMTRDEYTLAKLGYRQVFVRSFGLFENVCETRTRGHEVNRDADCDVVGRDFHDDEFRIWYAGFVRFCHVRVVAVWTQGSC
jgi:hypothetical protein